MPGTPRALVEGFFDPATGTVSYVVYDREGGRAAIVDPVLDYDARAGRTATASADRIAGFVRARGLAVDWILETHAHADHLSAAQALKSSLGGRVAIGDRIGEVQAAFAALFGPIGDDAGFDHLFADGEAFRIGELPARALRVPGHTPADVAYVVGDGEDAAAFVGDTLFMPDVGTARADFPGGDARALWRSLRRLLALPPGTRLHVCHDYPPAGREPRWMATVAEQRRDNVHARDGVTEDEFVRMRQARDAKLDVPALLLPSIQVNLRAGRLPAPEANGTAYLRIPLNAV